VVGGRSGLTQGCTSGEANDRADVALAGVQAQLVNAVAETGVPTIVVLVGGRPLALSNVVDRVPAILEAWLPGEEGGRAVADVLFGAAAPGGRLPVTLPRAVGQLPLYYNHKPSGARSQFWGDYADLPTTPLFPFGHGLSYTTFGYANLELSASNLGATETLRISFDVSNSGDRAGEEVAQLYVCDLVASVTRPVKELKGFKRLFLEPGETRRVTFSLDLHQLAFYDLDMKLIVEPGEVAIWVGSSSGDLRLEDSVVVTGKRRLVAAAAAKPTGVAVIG